MAQPSSSLPRLQSSAALTTENGHSAAQLGASRAAPGNAPAATAGTTARPPSAATAATSTSGAVPQKLGLAPEPPQQPREAAARPFRGAVPAAGIAVPAAPAAPPAAPAAGPPASAAKPIWSPAGAAAIPALRPDADNSAAPEIAPATDLPRAGAALAAARAQAPSLMLVTAGNAAVQPAPRPAAAPATGAQILPGIANAGSPEAAVALARAADAFIEAGKQAGGADGSVLPAAAPVPAGTAPPTAVTAVVTGIPAKTTALSKLLESPLT